jgi:hypothetical protein
LLATCFWGPVDSFCCAEGSLAFTEVCRTEANDRSNVVYLVKNVLPDDPWFVMRWFFLVGWMELFPIFQLTVAADCTDSSLVEAGVLITSSRTLLCNEPSVVHLWANIFVVSAISLRNDLLVCDLSLWELISFHVFVVAEVCVHIAAAAQRWTY